jgi:hypothetical protein
VLSPYGYQNYTWNCSNYSGKWECPPLSTDLNYTLGTQLVTTFGNAPSSGGDNRMTVDALDVFWQVGLYERALVYPISFTNAVISLSLDYGKTWALAANLAMTNTSAYSYDFNVVAGGSDGKGGAQFCVNEKVDSTYDELSAYGITQPLELNCFHTSKRGIVDSISRTSLVGTEVGGYGGMSMAPDGTIYITLQSETGVIVDPFTGSVLATSAGPLGTNVLDNGAILFVKCTPSPNVVCQPAKIIARADYIGTCPNPQPFRCTWTHPLSVTDKNGVTYVLYYDAVRNGPSEESNFFNFFPNYQATRILMIKSCDGGKTWSAPQSINDDAAVAGDPFSTPNIHFNLVAHYDEVTHTILAAWMDTRNSPTDETGTQIIAAVIPL